MKLAMATQGDHNTLAKLTVQTIMGFGMEMEETEMLTDKFAHSIQKSLIEWQDLASSVKFAMPFFVATGQSIDELLGGLEVLTNRALEAGIAGRGLRQALAQFAKHADDNSSALRKMGVEIMDAEGNMRALSDIAMDAKMAFGDVTDLEALTAMLEDMNVRGATAFALLVQNAGEYKEAVGDLANSAGEATQMADIQQQSLANQIQLVKNALLAPFLLTDEIGTANNTLNEFTHRMTQLVQEFTEFFIVILPDGTEELTEHSQALKDFVIHALGVAVEMIQRLKDVFLESNEGFESFTTLLDLAVVPMHLMLDILDKLGPNFLAYYIQFKLYTSLLPIMAVFGLIATVIQMKMMAAMIGNAGATEVLTASQKRLGIAMGALNSKGKAYTMQQYQNTAGTWAFNHALVVQTGTNKRLAMSWKAVFISMMLVFALFAGAVLTTGKLSDALMILAAGVALLAIALNFLDAVKKLGWYGIPVAMAGMAVILTGMHMARKAIQSHLGIGQASGVGETISMGGSGGIVGMGSARTMDSGGTYLPSYDNGGPTTEHGMAWLQKGETVNSKTANMLEGGITLNTGDVHVQDGEDFANRVAEALPAAIRRVSDTGGI
jgi:TP901 family phage tail tape measure protein